MTSSDSRVEATDTEACLFCGEPERVEVADIWTDGTFQIECCCEAMHDIVVRDMADDPARARALLRRVGVEELAGDRLRRVADDGCCTLLLDYQLELRPVAFPVARAFVAHYHQHCGPPVTWRFGHAIWNGHTMLGVAMAGNPVARAFNGRGVLEVNRLCIRRDVPRALAWNAASMLYGWCAREAERRGWARIITYTRTDEEGTSLRAAGWEPEATVRGRGWHGGRRSRSNNNAFIDKVRWGKRLSPQPPARKEKQHVRPPHPCGDPLDALVLSCEREFDPLGL